MLLGLLISFFNIIVPCINQFDLVWTRMSGIEIAGLVLGSFPILLNCLEYYRKGFEPLEEWWNFRTQFIAFVDDIRHQMMKYNENIIRLLDPIVADNDSLSALVRDAKDPRWADGSLIVPLQIRLGSESGRFLRVVKRMEEVVESLKKFLQIKDGDVSLSHRCQPLYYRPLPDNVLIWFLTRCIGLGRDNSGHGNGI